MTKRTEGTVASALPNAHAAGKSQSQQSASIQPENKSGVSGATQHRAVPESTEEKSTVIKKTGISKAGEPADESAGSSAASMHRELVSVDANKITHNSSRSSTHKDGLDGQNRLRSSVDPFSTGNRLNERKGVHPDANTTSKSIGNSLIAGKATDTANANNNKKLSLTAIIGLQPLDFSDPEVARILPGYLDKSLAASNIQHSAAGKASRSRSLKTNRSLQIGLLIAPDISEVRYNYNNKVGNNFGIGRYYLSNRLSLVSGFIVSKKNYTALGYDFHLPDNCGIDQRNVSFAASSARIYEIPLNLRYNIGSSGPTSFFISGGVSSYIMKKEQFKFFFHENNNGNRGWLNADYNSHEINWFSVMNISAGFETFITKNISIQAEPYFKVPFSGIGIGQVDLNSYGINFSVKYSPSLKHSRK